MSWVRLDDGFWTNPKVLAAQPLSRGLYLAGLCYSARELTDGVVPKAAIPLLLAQVGATKKAPADLVACGLWVEVDGGWAARDFLEFNKSRDEVLDDREKAKERQRRSRESRKVSHRDKPVTSPGVAPPPNPSPEGALGLQAAANPLPPPGTPPPQDPGSKATAAIDVLVERRLATAQARPGGVHSPDGYRAKTRGALNDAHRADAFAAARRHPELTADQLADLIETPPSPVTHSAPEHPCDECNQTGWTWADDEHDQAEPCPCPNGDRHRTAVSA